MTATRLALSVAAAVAAVVVVVLAFTQLDQRAAPPIVIEDPRAEATIVVAVEGAVASPGVYTLGADARVQDALAAAGGMTSSADLAALNPAQRVRDEERIVVPQRAPTPPVPPPPSYPPAIGAPPSATAISPPPGATAVSADSLEAVPAATLAGATAATRSIRPTAAAGTLDINRATAAELDTLPGIGPVLAQRIVDYRNQVAPFASVDDLENIQGISARMVEDLRPLVTVTP